MKKKYLLALLTLLFLSPVLVFAMGTPQGHSVYMLFEGKNRIGDNSVMEAYNDGDSVNYEICSAGVCDINSRPDSFIVSENPIDTLAVFKSKNPRSLNQNLNCIYNEFECAVQDEKAYQKYLASLAVKSRKVSLPDLTFNNDQLNNDYYRIDLAAKTFRQIPSLEHPNALMPNVVTSYVTYAVLLILVILFIRAIVKGQLKEKLTVKTLLIDAGVITAAAAIPEIVDIKYSQAVGYSGWGGFGAFILLEMIILPISFLVFWSILLYATIKAFRDQAKYMPWLISELALTAIGLWFVGKFFFVF
jgi:hypothetical protein